MVSQSGDGVPGRLRKKTTIFRWLYKRSMTRVFGRFIPDNRIKDPFSEWESFKLLLPRRIYRLFFTPVTSEIDALRALQKMILDASRDVSNVAGDKRGSLNSQTKPN